MVETQTSHSVGSQEHAFLLRVLRRFAVVGLIYGAIGLIQFGWDLHIRGFPQLGFLTNRFRPELVINFVQDVLFSLSAAAVLLLIGSGGLFRSKRWGRIALTIWAIVIITKIAIEVLLRVLYDIKRVWDVTNLLSYSYRLQLLFFAMMFLWTMVQSEVIALSAKEKTSRAFEVLPMRRQPTLSEQEAQPAHIIAPVLAVENARNQWNTFSSRLTSWTGMIGIAYGINGALGLLVLGFRSNTIRSIWHMNVLFAVEHVAWLAHLILVAGSLGMIRKSLWGRKIVIAWAAWQISAYLVVYTASFLMYPGSNSSTHPWSESAMVYGGRLFLTFMDRAAFPLLALCALLGANGNSTVDPNQRPL